MQNAAQKWLVETEWLAAHLDAPDLVVLDASLHLPTTERNAKAEYLAAPHPRRPVLRHRRHLGREEPAAAHAALHRKFASRMKKMGVGDGMHVVVYDSEGLYSAARAWWMFRIMGHDDVRGAERRPEEMEGRGAARSRTASRRAAPSATSRRAFTPSWCAMPPR